MIDTHSHIYLEHFDDDRDMIIDRARASGVTKILMPNIDIESVDPMLDAENSYPGYCHSMMGLHPTSVKEDFEEVLQQIKEQFTKHHFICVGEVGIDLYWDKTFKQQQLTAFEEQVNWAKEMDLPVVIHSRDAFPEVFSTIDKLWDNDLKGVFHSFNGDEDELRHILDYKTFYVGLNGVLTFKNSNLREVIKAASLGNILLETDAPYLTPVPNRGKRNEPSYVRFVCRQLAETFNMTEDEIDEITTANAKKCFF